MQNHSAVLDNVGEKGIRAILPVANDRPFNPPVFVSYASSDRDKYIVPLVRRLEKAGYTVWYDRQSIEGGDDWKHEIDQGLRKSLAVVVALTPNSIDPVKHPWAYYEQSEALRLFSPVIPIILEKCAYPPHFAAERMQYLDLTTLNKKTFARLQSAIEGKIHRRGKRLVDQTPNAWRPFVGREKELRDVYELLREGNTVAVTSQTTTAIQGMGGIGKTMVAEELLRRLGPRYPGGIFVERRGPNPTSDAQTVLYRWIEYTGHKPEGMVTPEQVRGWLENAGELLVLIDDVWPDDYQDVKQLLAALPPDADRLITTRFSNVAVAVGAHSYQLARLSESDGLAFLRDRLRHKTGELPTEELLLRLHRAVGGHALALELAVGRLASNDLLNSDVALLEQRISEESDIGSIDLDLPDPDRDVSLMISLDLSLRALQEADRRLRIGLVRRFKILGVFAPEITFDQSAARAVWQDKDSRKTKKVLNFLADYALVATEEGRYKQHLILQAYAMGLLNKNGSSVEDITSRHHNYYLAAAQEIRVSWEKTIQESGNIAHAANRICCQLGDALIHALGQANAPIQATPDFDLLRSEAALNMALAAETYVRDRRIHSGSRWLRAGLAASRLLGRKKEEAQLLAALGTWYNHRGQHREALTYSEQAVSVAEQDKNIGDLGIALNNIGEIYRATGNLEKSLSCYARALPIHRKLGDKLEIAITLNNIGLAYYGMKQLRKALRYYHRARPIFEEIGDRGKLAILLNNIGVATWANGEPEKALEYYEQVLPLREESGQPAGIAITLNNLGGINQVLGHAEAALSYYERALPVFRELEAIPYIVTALANIAVLLHGNPTLGRQDEANGVMAEAIALMEKTGLARDAAGRSKQELQDKLLSH